MKDPIQTIIRVVEVGEAQFLTRLIPLTVTIAIIAALYILSVFRGLDDAQSMDNAQLARQIVRGQGFTTKFIRPQAITDLRNHKISSGFGGSGELFPPAQFPPEAQRALPDTYNAPGFPCLLAGWFYLVRPQFNQQASPAMDGFLVPGKPSTNIYSGDRFIPILNLIFVLLTGLLVYILGRRLFDDRVAWMATAIFFFTDIIWKLSITALSTSFLMFLTAALLWCLVEIFRTSENCTTDADQSFAPAWLWAVVLAVVLAAACLTRLHLLVLLIPLLAVMILMPRPSWGIYLVIFFVVAAAVAPWFWRMYQISGNPFGSNSALLLYGQPGYTGNQIFCTTSIPKYETESLFRNASHKETVGYLWHMQNIYRLMGSCPMLFFFFASLLHAFKRRRAQMLQWFLVACGMVIIGINNIGVTSPEPVDAWNTVIILFPGIVLIGSAYFFILLDRLDLHIRLVTLLIVTSTLVVSAFPLIITLSSGTNKLYSFPPYMPPLIKILGNLAEQDEWVTTDLPWASAWYADHPSLWLPDSMTEFENLHDNVCPTGIMYLTPVTWSDPASNLMTGEYKDWRALIFAPSNSTPPGFPLHVPTSTPPGGPEYHIWSDRPRWSK